MTKYNRRIYRNLSELFFDIKSIMTQRNLMRPLMRGKIIDGAFRERLMLAVTSVNNCRYCSYAHAKQALTEGLDINEIQALQEGIFDNSPSKEIPALLYAQHWAEARGNVDPQALEKITLEYDHNTLSAINLTLRTIKMGNLLGNTLDFLLFKLSLGYLGNSRK